MDSMNSTDTLEGQPLAVEMMPVLVCIYVRVCVVGRCGSWV